jgi:hypothetical protein
MKRLAGYLLSGDAERAVVQFANAGVVCLERQDNRWAVAWMIVPALLP